MTTDSLPLSPRLAALQRELGAGRADALEEFWREVATKGTPLVEPTDDGDDSHVLVTFLWRAEGETRNVVVFGGFHYYWDFARNGMARLLDTDVWYKTERSPADVRAWYRLSPNDSLQPSTDWAARTAAFIPDPLNPRRYVVAGSADNPVAPRDEVWSVVELPRTPPQPWVQRRPNVPAGRVAAHRMHSAILDNDRSVWVYTPPGYDPSGAPYALLILFDGFIYTHVIPTPTVLDNLLAEGRIPPVIAVMVNSPDSEARLRELSCYPPLVDFLADELLPWVRQHYHVTVQPSRAVVGGSSLGGLTAAFAALRRPDLFGNVLSQSGSYWRPPPGDAEPHWLARQFEAAPRLPLRFYLDVGVLESEGQRRANDYMRDVLQGKGYPVRYTEFPGGHTFLCWQGTLSDGLLALLGRDWGSPVPR